MYTRLYQGEQTTLNKPFSVTGRSFFSNQQVKITCYPAKANTGLVFLAQGQFISVKPQNIVSTTYHISQVGTNGVCLKSTEHLLSALWGMGIDNAIMEYTGSTESPLLDGSSQAYVNKIQQVGVKKLAVQRQVVRITQTHLIQAKHNSGFMLIKPAEDFHIRVVIDFNNLIGCQSYAFKLTCQAYAVQIARARTFFVQPYTKTRYLKIRKQYQALPSNPLDSPVITHLKSNYVTNLRFTNESVRHKVLDLIGDLALLGYRLEADIFAYRPSHRFNQQVVKEIWKGFS